MRREEIRQPLWRNDTFVYFDQGLNLCIRQIREALGDNADSPQYIETSPRRGYGFVATVASADTERPGSPPRLIVRQFRMLRPAVDTDFLACSLPDALTNSRSGLESLVVGSSSIRTWRWRASSTPNSKSIEGARTMPWCASWVGHEVPTASHTLG